ncbi:MAG: M18 family aminopeptidase [Clostridia bacterium]|nr:M18 family aminopeptidase [Clostridia bacterium]
MRNEDERALALTEELIDFIAESPVSYWVIRNTVRKLEEAGYVRWTLFDKPPVPGGKYFITRNGSSLIAFRMTKNTPTGFNITAAHSDSPLFKIKTNHAVKACDRYLKLDTERYGSGILGTWLDRPLSVAGRAVVRTDEGISVLPVKIDRDIALIPNVCIHFNREINEGVTYNTAVDTFPLIGNWTDEPVLTNLVAENIGVDPKSIVSTELFLYNRMRGTVFGLNGEFVAAPQLDDQQCAFATLKGFLESEEGTAIPVVAIFDNEEVGSQTRQGAAGDLLRDVLERLAAVYEKPLPALVPSSLMLSCDNAHAMHPNHPELSDPLNAPHMNGGIVIKHNANQRYTTDAVSEALVKELCKRVNVPVQHFANRSDIHGGHTLGTITSSRVSMNTADIGLAQLAMHSSYETAGVRDTAYMVELCKAFFSMTIVCETDGVYRLA